MKKKILLILIIPFLLTGCGYDEYEMPEDAYINFNENVFDVYSDHSTKDLIKDTNVEILTKEETLDTNTVGARELEISYKFGKRKYKHKVVYEVYDVTEPIFISAPNNLTVVRGEETSLCNRINYADDYDDEPKCTVNGEYDLNNIGTYNNLEFIITDSSSNETKKEFTLNIVDHIDTSYNYSTPNYIYMDQILNNYKNDKTTIGIDVSKWQGSVDFNQVKNAGIEFVIMRIGYQTEPGGEFTVDPRFKEYIKQVKDAGLKFGIYVYNIATTEQQGIDTANWVLETLGDEKLDFPIAYDWENWSSYSKYKVSLRHFTDAYLAFEKTLNDKGYEAMLYSSKYYLENVWQTSRIKTTWLAHYTSNTDYEGKYIMWQMTSLAKINGITENTVDIDILYK